MKDCSQRRITSERKEVVPPGATILPYKGLKGSMRKKSNLVHRWISSMGMGKFSKKYGTVQTRAPALVVKVEGAVLGPDKHPHSWSIYGGRDQPSAREVRIRAKDDGRPKSLGFGRLSGGAKPGMRNARLAGC